MIICKYTQLLIHRLVNCVAIETNVTGIYKNPLTISLTSGGKTWRRLLPYPVGRMQQVCSPAMILEIAFFFSGLR